MALKREVSLGVGLATAALVWGIYNSALPSVAEARVSAPHDADLSGTERAAAWTAAAAVAGVSLLSKDPTVFVLGGGMIVALSWWHRHANHYDAAIGMIGQSGMATGKTGSNGMTDAGGYLPAAA
jgi:4-amino-4-deoxy-L-arabinose transferase-like glycosyltransferase